MWLYRDVFSFFVVILIQARLLTFSKSLVMQGTKTVYNWSVQFYGVSGQPIFIDHFFPPFRHSSRVAIDKISPKSHEKTQISRPPYPIGSMGLVYLPTFTIKINQVTIHVGKSTIVPWIPMGIPGNFSIFLPRPYDGRWHLFRCHPQRCTKTQTSTRSTVGWKQRLPDLHLEPEFLWTKPKPVISQ